MNRFTLPRDIYYGDNALEALKSFHGKKAFLCIGANSMKHFGFLDKAISYLEDAGFETKVFNGIEADPSVETVMLGAKSMSEFQPDWIIALGGGSPIDAAKAMWLFYEHPELEFKDICKPESIPPLRKKARFCAISTTSGTASEVTEFSIITDYKKGVKYPIASFELTPDVAIVDSSLAMTMPNKVVAHTGMDALSHAIESFVSTKHSAFTDPMALSAIRLIDSHLVKSYNGDKESRKIMHEAQCMAGMSFSNAYLGIVHSIAHATGAAFADYGPHIIHGAGIAMYLPKVVAFNSKMEEPRKRYAYIADFLQLGGETDDEKVYHFIEHLKSLNNELNIPHCIKQYGPNSFPKAQGFVTEDVFLDRLPEIAEHALADACTTSSPRIPTPSEMVKLLKCCYYGTDVDF